MVVKHSEIGNLWIYWQKLNYSDWDSSPWQEGIEGVVVGGGRMVTLWVGDGETGGVVALWVGDVVAREGVIWDAVGGIVKGVVGGVVGGMEGDVVALWVGGGVVTLRVEGTAIIHLQICLMKINCGATVYSLVLLYITKSLRAPLAAHAAIINGLWCHIWRTIGKFTFASISACNTAEVQSLTW